MNTERSASRVSAEIPIADRLRALSLRDELTELLKTSPEFRACCRMLHLVMCAGSAEVRTGAVLWLAAMSDAVTGCTGRLDFEADDETDPRPEWSPARAGA